MTVVVALLAGIGSGGAFAYETVKNKAANLQTLLTAHLQAGQSDLEAGKASLKQANTNHDVNLVNRAKTQFAAGHTEFMATKQIADRSQFLHQVEGLPDVGPLALSRHKAVDGVADMGLAISDAGVELSALAADIIAPPKGSQAGRTLLTVLDQANASLVKVRADLQRADKAAATVDLTVVPAGQQATFVNARRTIGDALAGMDEFQQFVPIIKEVLGGNGPRTYLVEQINPAELRPGGGLISTYSVLNANAGTLKLISSGDVYDLVDPRPLEGQRGYVAPPGPFRSLLGTTSWSFVDSNFYPDFPSNAIVAEQFVSPRIGTPINGVISIDYYTVAQLLQITGPMKVPGYGVTVDANNLIPIVMGNSLVQNSVNKPILKAIAGPLMQQISAIPPERWPALLGILNTLAGQRHLQVYFNNQPVENAMSQFGWSGNLNPTSAFDFMAEAEANLGATKANYFVTRHYSVTLERRGNMLHHAITVQLINNTPYIYKPNDFYRAYFRLFFPTNAVEAWDGLAGGRSANPAPPQGLKQLTGWATIPGYGNSSSGFFEYDTPWVAVWQGQHQIYWQKQPGIVSDTVDVTWNDGAHSYTIHGSLGQDMIITLWAGGATLAPAPAASAHLPSLSLG